MPRIRFDRVSFAYGGGDPILSDISIAFGPGWTGVVGANGAGKTTLVRLAVGALVPSSGAIAREPHDALCVVCEQRVDHPGAFVRALAEADDADAGRWRAELALEPDALARWSTLSPGERKRWQLAGALAAAPDVLVLDEPTNHVDAGARALLVRALARFRGVGVIVSHDRALLDSLPRAIVRVDSGRAAMYGGGYAAARAAWEAEADARRDEWRAVSDERRALERRLADARRDTAAAQRSTHASTRIKGPRDSDGRSMGAKNLAMWAADGAGRKAQVLRRAADDAGARAAALAMVKEKGAAIAVGWEPAPRRRLASLDGVELRAGDRVLVRGARAVLDRDARVHLAGSNGAGKSTLCAALVRAAALPADRVLHLAQERTAADARALAHAIRALDPPARGRLGQIAAALGLDPAQALASEAPSPGEARKLEIALGLARRVWLCVLDEPTNHLDLPSIERLEAALAAYPGALVVVSHDDTFAARLTTSRWSLADGALVT